MDILSMFIIAVLGIWFVSGIFFMYKKIFFKKGKVV